MRRTQPISIADLYRFKIPLEPSVSPDGKYRLTLIVFSFTEAP